MGLDWTIRLKGYMASHSMDANTGQVTKTVMIPGNEFGEGMTYYDGNLVQITWKAKKGHVYSSKDLTKVTDFTYFYFQE